MLRAVLFDFNGVIVDDEPVHFALFRKVLAEEGVELTEADYYEKYAGLDDKGCFSAVLAEAGRPVSLGPLMRLITRKAMAYQAVIREQGYPFFDGAIELIRDLADAGLMLGVVSGALRDEVEGALRQAEVLAAFKVLITAEDVERSKPDPEGYEKALQALNSQPPLPARLVHPHEVLVLEDTPAGLSAAQAVGLATVGIGQTYPVAELAQADAVMASLQGVTEANLRALHTGLHIL